jgi:iron complex outermembrane receptor protein
MKREFLPAARRLIAFEAVLLSVTAMQPAAAQQVTGTATPKPVEVADASGAAGSAPAANGASPPSSDTGVADITVTARYRPESESKVPIAISVVDSKTIANEQLYTLTSITKIVPSLQIQGINPRNQTVAIRGLGANPGLTTEGFEPGVGIYIDGVYYERPSTVLFDIFGVDNIAVLRGPQGTLFGRNTTAGAVSVTTSLPQFSWHGAGQVSYGDYNYIQAQGSITGPITDTLAFSLTGGETRRDDTIKTTNPNEETKGLRNDSVRGQLLFRPSDEFSFRLIGDYNDQNFTGPHQVISSVLPRTLANGSTVKNWFDHAADAGYVPPAGIGTNPESRESDINSPNFWNQKSYGASLQADWTPSDGLLSGNTLTSITAWRDFELLPKYDSDYSGVNYYQSLFINIKQKQFSQELRLASTGNRKIDYTIGAYFFSLNSNVDSHSIYGSQASQFNYGPTVSPLTLNGLDANTFFTAHTKSYSGFGQLNWHVTDKLSLLGGVRYTYEDKSGDSTSVPAGIYAPISSLPAAQQATAVTRRATIAPTNSYEASWRGGQVSGTASLSYQWTPQLMTYVNYSRGFQAAGLNLAGVSPGTPTVVQPETVNSYEVGVKSSLLNDHLTLNVDGFWTDVSNYQATIFDTTLGGKTYIANAGSVRSRGIEADARAVPFTGLSLSGSLIYDDARYTKFDSTTCPYLQSYLKSCDIAGEQLAGASRWAGSVQAEYSKRVADRAEAYFGGNVTARTGFYSQLNDDPFSRVPGYSVTDIFVGVRSPDRRWDVSIWVHNLFNKYYINSYTPSTSNGYVTASVGDPRFVGATLRGKF